jgi:hypothetical protein
MPEAFHNCERDRMGCTSDWCNGDGYLESSAEQVCNPGFRVTSQQAREIAAKLSAESEQWFEHKISSGGPCVKPQSDGMKRVNAKYQGTEMQQILAGANRTDMNTGLDLKPARRSMTPDAQRFAVLSQQGTVSKVLNFDTNQDCQPPDRRSRAVKPEATATFEKNKGCMADCLQVRKCLSSIALYTLS